MPFLAIGGDNPDRGALGLVDTPNAYIENMRKECFLARKRGKSVRKTRRRYSDEFKDETVQRLLDGHSATSIAKNLGLSGTSILYRWKHGSIRKGARTASVLDTRVQELEEQLRTLARERDILKKTLSIFIQKGWWTYYLANGRLVGKGFAVWMVCETLQVGRSGYYACQRGMVGEGERTDRRLMAQVRSIFLEHKRRYGTRRISKEPED